MRNLSQAEIGEDVVVEEILGSSNLRLRVMELGLTKGTKVVVKKVAPLGTPMAIAVRGYELCLGKREAERILLG